jgi:putative membrane protein insertion efficiency factor
MYLLVFMLVINPSPRETNPLKIVARCAIGLYQKLVSPGQGEVCNFSPSCSRYSSQAIGKYGAVTGLLMTADRLMRCNPGAYKYYGTSYPGLRDGYLFDPPENNFIFHKRPWKYYLKLLDNK